MFSFKYKAIKQNDMKDCGAACITTLLRQYKSKIAISRIREIAGTSEQGTNVFGIVKTLESFNFKTKAIKGDMSLFEEEGLPYPAIAHVIKDGMLLHFVTIHAVKKNHLIISDPAEGLVKILKKDFEKMWTKVIVFAVPTEKYEIISDENPLSSVFSNLAKDKVLLCHVAIVALTSMIIGILTSFYFQTLIDSIIPEGAINTLNIVSIGIMFAYIFQSVFDVVRSYLLAVLGNRMSIRLMLGYYNHILGLPFNFFATRKAGEIISRFTDANKVVSSLASSFMTVILDFSMIVVISFVMFFQNSTLFFISLLSIPFYSVIIFAFIKKYGQSNKREMENNSHLNSFIIESLNGIETIKSLQAENTSSRRVDSLFIKYIDSAFKTFNIDNLQTLLKQLVKMISNTLILWYGARLVINGNLSVGQLITFNMMASYFSTPLMNVINLQPQIQAAKVAAERLGEIMSLEPEIDDDASSQQIQSEVPFKNSIQLSDVSFNYPMQRECLSNINISINMGEKVAFVGKSGSGKSTLSKLLLNYYQLTSGKIAYSDFNIKDINKQNLREHVTLVPQNTFFFSGTIYENLIFGIKRDVSLEDVIEVCKITHVHEHIESLPLGYSSYLEENASNLSGGQKQRLALARALLRKTRILILDEATSSVDTYTESEIMNHLMNIEQLTLIVIAHRLPVIKNCNKIYILEDKTIVESGNHESLLSLKGKYNELWEKYA